ncbi:MAG: BON domain-containing protein [Candidatus Competibacteraceae bacterium]
MAQPYQEAAFHDFRGLFLSILLSAVCAIAGITEKPAIAAENQTTGRESLDRASKIVGAQVHNQNGKRLGKLEDLIFAPERGQIIYALLSADDTLGIKDKWFIIPWRVLRLDTDKDNYLLDIDKAALMTAPSFNKNDWPDLANERWREEIDNYYRQKPYRREQTEIMPEKNTGNIINDTVITARVKAALLSYSITQGLNLSVETSQGEVRLSGAVDTLEQANQAVRSARAVEGVKTVKDAISIESCPEHELC